MKGPNRSGGSCRSMSIGIRMSPRAWSMPAVSAASLPKLRDRLTTRMRGSCRLRSSRLASVSSCEPSFTNTISKRKPARSRNGSTVVRNSPIDSSSLNTGTTSDSNGSAGRRARWTASWRSRADDDLAGRGRDESGTTGSLHHPPSGDDFDRPVDRHDAGIDAELGLALADLGPEGVQRLGVALGLERLVGLDAGTIGDLRRAAIAVREADDAVDIVKLHGNREILPECLLPLGKFRRHHADRPARDDELAVAILHAVGGHVDPAAGREARIDAVEQHGLIVA